MEASAQFGVYYAVLRKHLVLLAVSSSLVIASGVFYVVRQQKVFQSSATLVIETPPPNLAIGTDYGALLAQQQEDLNTQVFLLKQTPSLAAQAVERLKAQNVDVVAGDYTEKSLPANVKVEFIPATSAVSFSLTGPDAASLPSAVNAYAQVFKESSEGDSAKRSDQQRGEFVRAVDDANEELTRRRREQDALVDAHKGVDLASDRAAEAETLEKLRAELPGQEIQNGLDVAQKSAILAAVAKAGVVATESGGVWSLAPRDDGAKTEARLADDESVCALECVSANNFVQRYVKEELKALDKDRALKERSVKEDFQARTEAQQEAKDAHTKCGRQIAAVVVAELGRIDARLRQYEATLKRADELDRSVSTLNALRAQHRNLAEAVKQQKIVVEDKTERLRAFDRAMVQDADDANGRAARATRRILIKTPAAPNSAVQIAPKVPLIIGLTIFAALAVGLGLVLLFEYLDDTIKSKEDFDRYVGLPFLGFIPRIDAKESGNPDIAASARTGSSVAEAFRAVRTSILFSRSDKPVRTILVTSAGPGEGKTTVAANLAITLAQHKGPVLLIDADLRRPRVAKALGVENKVGLTNFLIGESTLDQVVQKTSIDGVFVVTSGPIPPNPAELLHGERLATLLKAALERFDRVVIDSPPVIAVSDARVVARCADGLYLVISMGKTSWRLIQRSKESLTSIGFEVHGAILNNLAAPTGRYGYYYYRDYEYGKGYYQQPQKQQPAPKT
jgi:capsular exopolysaccharide synthesis family protein